MVTTIEVPSMVCDACVRTITTAIQAQLPQAQVQADLATHQLTVQAESAPEQIRELIVAAGHEVAA
ncbi:MAG: heavy-metal-associated domain-containing protein [Cyanobacteria bacterium P01_G01_bin.54]